MDSKWRLSMDSCKKCHFFLGTEGAGLLTGVLKKPQHPPPLATPLCKNDFPSALRLKAAKATIDFCCQNLMMPWVPQTLQYATTLSSNTFIPH